MLASFGMFAVGYLTVGAAFAWVFRQLLQSEYAGLDVFDQLVLMARYTLAWPTYLLEECRIHLDDGSDGDE